MRNGINTTKNTPPHLKDGKVEAKTNYSMHYPYSFKKAVRKIAHNAEKRLHQLLQDKNCAATYTTEKGNLVINIDANNGTRQIKNQLSKFGNPFSQK